MKASEFGKVGVLFGGRSSEREVSIMSGTGVLNALHARGVDAHAFDPAAQTLGELETAQFDRVFIALHGRGGEDGAIQGVLETLRIPYTGSGVQASAIAIDKVFTKRIWETHKLPTPRYRVIVSSERAHLNEVADELRLPLIVKPPNEGSTIGISRVSGYSGMAEAFTLARKYDDVVLAEEFIEGQELTCAILGQGSQAEALPLVEIRAPDANYDYHNKYFGEATKYLCPAPIDAALSETIRQLSVRAYNALGARGWGRIDIMLSKRGEPFLLELNTSPGMTGHSLVPIAARAVGIDYEDLVLRILALATLEQRGSAQ
ncbi:MAG: D-alanine--D-alanine ligase [Pseudomonadota bacterium]|nr:D-alanine--D-alanine ligase [Burkholderiaceae bacterium]MDQ3445032.1 D-alanine--D-alanine ligase [Pseudomonadota bacterium]